jgi:hypothetical protein
MQVSIGQQVNVIIQRQIAGKQTRAQKGSGGIKRSRDNPEKRNNGEQNK